MLNFKYKLDNICKVNKPKKDIKIISYNINGRHISFWNAWIDNSHQSYIDWIIVSLHWI